MSRNCFSFWRITLLSTVLFVPNLANAQQLTHTCKFNKGPRAGQTISYTAAHPIPVGSVCQDGVASTGLAVPDNPNPQLTHTCKFDQGPRTGQTEVYPQSMPVGASCWDGVSSGGVTIADNTSAAEPAKPPQNPANVPRQEEKPPQPSVQQQETPGHDPTARTEPSRPSRESKTVDFLHAPFKHSRWMDALYDEDFSLLNEDRISVLSYLLGVHRVLNTTHDDSACREAVNQTAARITALAYLTGKEKETLTGDLTIVTGGVFPAGGDGAATYINGANARSPLVRQGEGDAAILLREYGGCSSPTFKRVYSGIVRFALNNGPAFREANATPVLKLEISGPYVDRFWTEQTGKPYVEFTVRVTNYEDLPKDMFSGVGGQTYDEVSASGEIFASDGRILSNQAIQRPRDLTRLLFNAVKGELPEKAYLILYDRKHDKVYRSGVVAVPTSAVASAPAVQAQPPPPRKKN